MSNTVTGRAVRINPYLAGNHAPIHTEDDFEPTVRGTIPAELNGAYYRNGPNPQFDPGPDDAYHPFIGDGMIHGFWLAEGRARYRNRYVRTDRWRAEHQAGRRLFGGMGLPSDPSVAEVHSGGANTNIVYHAGKLLALQEASNPFELEAATLASKGWLETGGRFTAHPKIDHETGELVWFAYAAASKTHGPLNSFIDYGVTAADGRILRRDRFEAPYCSMIHDFMITRNYVLFPVLPLVGDLERAKQGGPAFAWDPSKGAFLGVMKRNAGVDTLRWFEVDPRFVFHPMNAWEEGSKIHCELMEYGHAPLFPALDGTKPKELGARLTRWTLDLAGDTNRVQRERLADIPGEFPRFDERLTGLPYRHGWYAANHEQHADIEFDSLIHVDLQTGSNVRRSLPAGESVGEPIFVPKHATAPEGDGYVLATLYSQRHDQSSLLILNAQDIAGEPVATLELPRRIPVGFHGNWVAAT